MTRELSIPVCLAGTHEEVTRRLRSRLKAFMSGEPWFPIIGEALVEVRSVDGLVVLSGPAPLLTARPHIHAYLPLSLLAREIVKGRVDREREAEAIHASLASAWGVLGVLSPPNSILVYPPERHRPILDAALRFWDELDEVGARYTVGLADGANLWGLPTNLRYVLAHLGVPTSRLIEPLPSGGLRALVTEHLSP